MITTYNKVHVFLLLAVATLLLGACSTAPVVKPEGAEIIRPEFAADRVLAEDVKTVGEVVVSDPWEGFNRTMYRFNYRFDRYVFLPATRAYQFIAPDPVEKGVHNFFRNVEDVTTLINSILQLDLIKTMNTTTRLAINSTIGLAGFLDIANDVPRSDEDFGQTLGYWGVGSGPYLVLPILGPSSVRDGVGDGVDLLAGTAIRDEIFNLETWQEWTWTALFMVDVRAHTAFRYYETGSPFEYEWVRLLFTTKRQLDIER